ncbi:MAG: acetyltransferase [Gammaproteobacteria bacterium]|nr:acetyltransferase [Gammaproteobacteria bacterium]
MNNGLTRPVIVLGAGGHAKVVANALKLLGQEIVGFVAAEIKQGSEFLGSSVLGDEQVLNSFLPDDVVLANGIGAMPNNNARWRVAAQMRERGYSFTSVIHPSVVIAQDVDLDEGVQVMAGSIIQPGVRVGRDTIINTGVLLDHDCRVGEECHLAPGVVCSGSVHVGEGAHLGTGTVVIQNISIGGNSVVAAGSVIYRDVPESTTFIQTRKRTIESREN